MATAAQSLPQRKTLSQWIPSFLRDELRFYPGRAGKIARITISCILTFIVMETFRIPSEVYGVIAVFLVSRDTPADAIRSTIGSILATAVGVSVVLVGATVFADSKFIHFFYLIVGFFVLFYLSRILVNPVVAPNMVVGFYAANVIWDGMSSTKAQVEGSLWVLLGISTGLVIACLVEIAFVRQRPLDQLRKDIDERVRAVSEFFMSMSAGDEEAKRKVSEKLASLAVVGTGRLRREMQVITRNHSHALTYYAELSAFIALTGQLVDTSAGLSAAALKPTQEDRLRFRNLSEESERIRSALAHEETLEPITLKYAGRPSTTVTALPALEQTIQLFPLACQNAAKAEGVNAPSIDGHAKPRKFIVNDAWSNPDHLHFALKGALAGMICYIVYSAVDWQGISTAVLTCFLTALSTIGASKQKQFNRLAGAIAGGALGLASLIFILPWIDTIGGISLVIAVGTAFAAWFSTASPRISYFGLQTALAFYLTLLQGFAEPTSLTPPRDRLVGVLLSIVVMGVVFDHLWPTTAFGEVRRELVTALRNMGKFAALLAEDNREVAGLRIASLRESITTEFANVHTNADSIKFEFGPDREAHLALRENALRWKSVARTLYLVELSLGRHLTQISSLHPVPPALHLATKGFCLAADNMLQVLADHIMGLKPTTLPDVKDALARVEKEIADWFNTLPEEGRSTSASLILSGARQFVTIAESLDADIQATRLGGF